MLNQNTFQKGLCHTPEFLDYLETQMECLTFPYPNLEQPTVIGTESKTTLKGTDRAEREMLGWQANRCNLMKQHNIRWTCLFFFC